jgi:hypothetical protein
MAHYAFLNENNVVTEVITGVDENELIEGLSPEVWYGNLRNQTCIRTSYSGSIRKNYAGIGYIYDGTFDAFIPPQPFASWKLNYETFQWEAPIAKPEPIEGYAWLWGEANKEWVKVQLPTE